ncbi:MAG TPA: hypothetical protein ENJ85_03305 [Oceanithermus profundus]|uniref:Uncharacterized protein n=1 Tax=Oceanithermus profundus TaxID=187137 RepID=A0A7C5WVF3_9DEIN|nr:hypothetical protein [Oceanithermus profundus]
MQTILQQPTGLQQASGLQNSALAHQPIDAGACGMSYGGGPIQALPAPVEGQLTGAANVYAIQAYFGVNVVVDQDGNFYSPGTGLNSATGNLESQLTPLGNEFRVSLANGFAVFYGLNIIEGAGVAISKFSNPNNLEKFQGEVPAETFETTGCWCPFEECAVATQGQDLIMTARSIPGPNEAPTTPQDNTGNAMAPGFYNPLRLSLLGVLYRNIGGCATIGPMIPFGTMPPGGPQAVLGG